MLLLCLSLGFTTSIPNRLEKKFEWRFYLEIIIADADCGTGLQGWGKSQKRINCRAGYTAQLRALYVWGKV